MTSFDQAVDHLRHYLVEDGRISMQDICAFARLHTDLRDAQFAALAERLIEMGIEVSDFDAEESQIVEEIEERERGLIRENTQLYMRDVGEFQLLSRDEELACARAMNEAMSEVLAAIAPVKTVNESARQRLNEHAHPDRIKRVVAGFLDHVEVLPDVELADRNVSNSEREDPFDYEQALHRRDVFEAVSGQYFATARQERSPSQLIAVEESFRLFKFTTNHYTDLLDLFKQLIKDVEAALAKVQSICATAGLSQDVFENQLKPRLTHAGLARVVTALPNDAQSSINAHMHIIERARRSLRKVESQAQIEYLELLKRDQAVNQALQQYREAKNQLVSGNLRLVMRVAQTYSRHGALLLDLVQEGNLGLIRAAEKYDYTRGFKFVTYATWWIRQAVTQALNEFGRTVKLPASLLQSIRNVTRARNKLTQLHGRDPTLGELAKECALTVQQVRDIVLYEHNAISIDEPLNEEEDTSLVDTLISETVPSPEQLAMEQGLRHAVELTLADLTIRETQILTLRYGIGRSSDMSTSEIASELGISANRVRQLSNKALKRLRQPRYTPILEPYL